MRDLTKALERLAGERQLRLGMGEAGRRRAVELYAWGRIGEPLAELYRELASREPTSLRQGTILAAEQ